MSPRPRVNAESSQAPIDVLIVSLPWLLSETWLSPNTCPNSWAATDRTRARPTQPLTEVRQSAVGEATVAQFRHESTSQRTGQDPDTWDKDRDQPTEQRRFAQAPVV